jgi:hypothetical protein
VLLQGEALPLLFERLSSRLENIQRLTAWALTYLGQDGLCCCLFRSCLCSLADAVRAQW